MEKIVERAEQDTGTASRKTEEHKTAGVLHPIHVDARIDTCETIQSFLNPIECCGFPRKDPLYIATDRLYGERHQNQKGKVLAAHW